MPIEKRKFEVLRDDGWCVIKMKDMKEGDIIRSYGFDQNANVVEGVYKLTDRPRIGKIQEHLLPEEEQNWGIIVDELDPKTLKVIK